MISGCLGMLQGSSVVGYATFNPSDKGSSIVLSGGDLIATNSSTSTWRSVRATIGKSSGKAVFEMKPSSATVNLGAGFADASPLMSTFLGASSRSVLVRANGSAYTASGVTTSGSPPASSTNPIMFALDLSAGKGWVALNGTWVSGDPAAGTSPSFTWTAGTIIYPAASVFTSGGISETFNAGATAFSNTVPSGFSAGWFS